MIPGWTYVSNGGFDIYEDNEDGLVPAQGSYYVSFGHDGTNGGSLTQTFATAPGRTYTVSYFVAEQQGDDPTQDMQAILTNGAQQLTADNTALPSVFQHGKSISFTASGTSATIEFLDATPAGGGGSSNLALDGVAVSSSVGGVPEPTSWLLLIMGIGMAGAGLRTRRTAPLIA